MITKGFIVVVCFLHDSIKVIANIIWIGKMGSEIWDGDGKSCARIDICLEYKSIPRRIKKI